MNYLNKNFIIFQEDIYKPIFEQDTDIENTKSLEKLIILTKYKEELIKTNSSIYLIKELMTLYQKVIYYNCLFIFNL